MGTMHIAAMTVAHAEEVVTWRYPPPYDVYDMTGADPGHLACADSGFYAVLDGEELIGFRSFGPDGQVPGGPYDESALDTGGGLRPDLTGRGLGRRAISTGLAFGITSFSPTAFRMTVAAFNVRAHRVVESLGFARIAHFEATAAGPAAARSFVVFGAAVTALNLDVSGPDQDEVGT
jgi:RimJ/RimL family protein N-acetyltransferase